jgi:hypothetical protein
MMPQCGLDTHLLFRGHGRKRYRLVAVRTAVRSHWDRGPSAVIPAHHSLGAACFSGRVQYGVAWHRSLGPWNGGSGIDRSGGRHDGARQRRPSAYGLFTLTAARVNPRLEQWLNALESVIIWFRPLVMEPAINRLEAASGMIAPTREEL